MNVRFEFGTNNRGSHKFIQSTGEPFKSMVTEMSLLITNQYLGRNHGAKKWRKIKTAWNCNYEFPPGQKKISDPINYLIISEHVRKNKHFDPKAFNLPDLECMWLDHAVEFKLDFHKFENSGPFGLSSGDLQAHYYGKNYPIQPLLQREGRLFTSFQPQLLRRIIAERNRLIENSNESLNDDWIFDLRNLISDTISLLDVALNQLYIKAEYDPLPAWEFDAGRLGERHGRRLNDKLKWIFQITKNHLDIRLEKDSLDNLRSVRNHLMHFDPPSLVITLEEAAIWINQVIDVGKIIVKIRKAIGVDISTDLVNFLLQKEAIFVPFSQGERKPLNPNKKEDYYSSVWPNIEE